MREKQAFEYGECTGYPETNAQVPENETPTTISSFFVPHEMGCCSNPTCRGILRKKSTFADQLVLPQALTGLVLHAYYDHVPSGGHLASRPTYDKIRQKYWWPNVNRDLRNWCQDCQDCQRRKTAHNRTKMPTGHVPVQRPFKRISVDLVDYKTESVPAAGIRCKYVFSMMDYLTRYAALTPIPNKLAVTVTGYC